MDSRISSEVRPMENVSEIKSLLSKSSGTLLNDKVFICKLD